MRRLRPVLAITGGFIAATALVSAIWVLSLGPAPLGKLEYSHVVLDREGRLLRAYATSEGRWRLPVTEREVDPGFLKMLFAYEDKRFRDHPGVDPLSMGRAAVQFISRGHIVSGGSTISMQVARLLEPRERRNLGAKMRQIVRALELERALGKDGVLALYLTLAPYGGNLEGVRAASLAYFGKEPRKLSLAEAALLVALPQSPELRRPDRFPTAARAARDRVLDRAALAWLVPRDEMARAKSHPVPRERKPLPVLAPHAADQVVLLEPDRREHSLTLDLFLQKNLQELAHERAQALGPDISVAILAVDNASGEARARVASADYFDARRAGQVDMTQALRSPGSTLKPFIYGLGFEDGVIHPDTLIDDRPTRYGSYMPENFDLTFQGVVTVRRALQLSLNVPAVAVLNKIGVSRLGSRLSQAGAALVLPKDAAYGALSGGRIAFKTGTSYGYRDAWAIGYDGRMTVGVWVGRPDGAPVPGLVGRGTAAPILFEAFARSGSAPAALPRAPKGAIFATSGKLPPPLQRFGVIGLCEVAEAPRIMFPPDGARLEMTAGGQPDLVALKISGGRGPLTVLVNGVPMGVPMSASGGRGTLFFQPDGPGFVRLTVMDARGASDSVIVRLQ
jgi:penicillin-binding protein 1C